MKPQRVPRSRGVEESRESDGRFDYSPLRLSPLRFICAICGYTKRALPSKDERASRGATLILLRSSPQASETELNAVTG